MADEIVFVNGIGIYAPHDNAPDFVIANVTFDKQRLLEFLDTQPDQFRASMKRSREGKLYMAVDTYVRQERNQAAPAQTSQKPPARTTRTTASAKPAAKQDQPEDEFADDLPF